MTKLIELTPGNPVIGWFANYILLLFIATQERVVNGERRHAEPPGGNDHPQLSQRLD
jgi:hypothetical protein